MTLRAVGSIAAAMRILRGMAGIAVFGCARVHSIGMAFTTSSIDMRPSQREGGLVVIEGHIAPTRGRMALPAVRPKLTLMIILRGMTGIAVLRRALEISIRMA